MQRFLGIALMGAVVGLMVGCSHQPLDEQPPKYGELGEGPGVFSGADGKFVIIGNSKKRKY